MLLSLPASAATLKKIAVIDLPGARGEHFDHLAMDYEDHYLLSAHVGPGILYVIDVRYEQAGRGDPWPSRNHGRHIRA